MDGRRCEASGKLPRDLLKGEQGVHRHQVRFEALDLLPKVLLMTWPSLAQAEIYTVLAHLFRKFDMELLTDKLTTRDVFVQALPEEGVQVIFKPKST